MTVKSNIAMGSPWYALFSRGARDWLRHNEKLRQSVQSSLPDLVTGPDLITGSGDRTVQVPVRMLEHARFRLAEAQSDSIRSAGQGQGQAAMRPPQNAVNRKNRLPDRSRPHSAPAVQ